MALEDDLKARTSALISQQMANWVVDIQRAIQGHQGALVRALDELGEQVARYDEKLDERAIAAAVADVLRQQPPPPPSADYSGLKASMAAIEKGASLSEVLTHLVTEVNRQLERVAIFIIKNNAAVGWYGRGFERSDVVKTLNIPLGADTIFRVVCSSRHATRGHVTHSPGTTQALARLGGAPQGILAVPLILRDKVAAVLYADTPEDEVAPPTADLVEILVAFSSKVIDLLSAAGRSAAAGATSAGIASGTTPGLRAAAANEASAATVMWSGGAGPAPAPAPMRTPTAAPATPAPSVVPFAPAATPPSAPAAPAATAAVAQPPLAGRALAPEEQKAHDDAKRFARLVVSEIKLYNEAKVTEGRRTKDIYERLREDIERGRQMYRDRVPASVRNTTDYFQDELVRILAGGDASALGSM
ncbi:MAG TPA: hypothetical protein VMX54_08325 [Vicinamibacteria bacterium]|nr:hypothetical protein [Vicinamibacteria bacterium]